MNLRQSLGYYFLSSYRRKLLDAYLFKYSHLYRGTVLDIGGRDRGKFKSPKDRVEKWIITDIEESRKPDIILDVCDMRGIENESIDVVNALELFEHVKDPEKGLRECFRVLKKEGHIIISMPFLYPVHADPYDFQRWTAHKWEQELRLLGLDIETITPMGRCFSVLGDLFKSINLSFGWVKYIGFLFYPIMDGIVSLDNLSSVVSHKTLGKYTTGYFIIAKK